MRIVLDTNVLISSLVAARSAPAQILARCNEGELELLVSLDTLAELRRVLAYPRIQKRLHYDAGQIDAYVDLLQQIGAMIDQVPTVRAVPDDADDDKFVALALAGNASYLVTGDEHLLVLGQYQGIRILKPAAFLGLWKTLRPDLAEE